MGRLIAAVDGVLMAGFTRLAHGVQRATGLRNFWLASQAAVAAALYAIPFIYGQAPFSKSYTAPIFVLPFFVYHLKIAYDNIKIYQMVERHYLRGSAVMHTQTLIWRESVWQRVLFPLTLAVYSVACMTILDGWFWRIFLAASFCANGPEMYFKAVVPLPPGPSALERLGDRIRMAFRMPVPATLPVRSRGYHGS